MMVGDSVSQSVHGPTGITTEIGGATAPSALPDPIQPDAGGTTGYNPYWYAINTPSPVR